MVNFRFLHLESNSCKPGDQFTEGTRFAVSGKSGQVTGYHKNWGQWLVIGLVALHVVAILFYVLVRRQTLVRPMLHGDRTLPAALPASRDDLRSRLVALAVMAACSGAVAWMVQAAGG